MSNNLLRPDLQVAGVLDLPLDQLWQQGIRGLLFDLDNTLTLWRCMEVSEPVRQWLAAAQAQGFRLAIVSNSFASRVTPIGQLLAIPSFYQAGKPRRRGLLAACAALKLEPAQVAMVGDQLFTDILAARGAGLYAILTQPIHPREFWGTSHVSRPLERLVKRALGLA